jgi:hypothetical protein
MPATFMLSFQVLKSPVEVSAKGKKRANSFAVTSTPKIKPLKKGLLSEIQLARNGLK